VRAAIVWGLVLWIIIAAGVVTARHAPPRAVAASAASDRDPTLTRCQTAAVQDGGGGDPGCRAAWRAAREHFFGKPGR